MRYPDLMKLDPIKKTRVVKHITGFAMVYQVQYTCDGHQWFDWGNATTVQGKALDNAEKLVAPRTSEVIAEFE